ncbi:MAG: butyrate kinase [Oscillospiraceae bacterium]|jgi:butyrate kinase|nr:butyrate kinase [Oscillospiraceae bacterium]
MDGNFMILVINFGSTSTKIAVFNKNEPVFKVSFDHGQDGYPKKFRDLAEHEAFATELIKNTAAAHGFKMTDFDVFVARGGGQVFTESGAYLINDVMIEDTKKIGGDRHPGKLGPRIGYAFSKEYGKNAYIVNGPSVDEYDDVARLTGMPEILRTSHIHTLNQKEVAYRYADGVGRKYADLNLIVCHIGGGISVTAHKNGRMIDSTDIIEGDGPMSPTRSGALPAIPLVELCYSGKYDKEALMLKIVKTGGLMGLLGTDDLREVLRRIDGGDKFAGIAYETMIYQIAKYAGSMAVALDGAVDAILLTGGMARSSELVGALTRKLSWLAPVAAFPGEFEMEGLAAGIMRVVDGGEPVREYTGVDVWTGFEGREGVT